MCYLETKNLVRYLPNSKKFAVVFEAFLQKSLNAETRTSTQRKSFSFQTNHFSFHTKRVLQTSVHMYTGKVHGKLLLYKFAFYFTDNCSSDKRFWCSDSVTMNILWSFGLYCNHIGIVLEDIDTLVRNWNAESLILRIFEWIL